MFLKQNTFSPTEGMNVFLKGLEDTYNLSIQVLKFDGLEIRVECVTLGSLERLWRYFLSRRLNEIAEMCILTDEVKKKLNLKNMRLTTIIKEEDYETCRGLSLGEWSHQAQWKVKVRTAPKLLVALDKKNSTSYLITIILCNSWVNGSDDLLTEVDRILNLRISTSDGNLRLTELSCTLYQQIKKLAILIYIIEKHRIRTEMSVNDHYSVNNYTFTKTELVATTPKLRE